MVDKKLTLQNSTSRHFSNWLDISGFADDVGATSPSGVATCRVFPGVGINTRVLIGSVPNRLRMLAYVIELRNVYITLCVGTTLLH